MNAIDPRSKLSLSNERRHAPRRKPDSIVYLNVGRDNGGILLDLSESGMCISVANPLVASSRIDFSLGLDDQNPVSGYGIVSWRSASGRSAGVRFVDWPNASRERVRHWLAGNGAPINEPEPAKTVPAAVATTEPAAATRPSAYSVQAPASKPMAAPPEAPLDSENVEKRAEPQTPLFFFPHKQGSDPEVEERLPWQPSNYTPWGQETGRDDEDVNSYRSAIGMSSDHEQENEEEERRDHRFQKLFVGFIFSLALLAAGVAGLVAYPNQASKLRQFAVSFAAPHAAVPAVARETHRFVRRFRPYVPRRRAHRGPQRGSSPVRDTSVFDAPSQSNSAFSTEVTDPSNQRWVATASSERYVPRTAPTTPAATPSAGPANSQPAELASNETPAQTGGWRVDGSLVEEGSIQPTFAPLNLNGQTLISKPIVVEAVIGKDGSVQNAHVLGSQASQLANAVLSAVRHWHYRPFYQNGQPVEFVTRITFDFSLPASSSQ